MKTKISDNKHNVLELQTFLREIALIKGEIKLVNPDGIFGADTTQAVRDVQERLGFTVTGEVDFETWRGIYNEYKDIQNLEP